MPQNKVSLNELFLSVERFNFAAFRRWHEIDFYQTEERLWRFQHHRPVISDISQLNSITAFEVNQAAGVAWVGFRDSCCRVRHCETLILSPIVMLDTEAINVVIIRINDLDTKLIVRKAFNRFQLSSNSPERKSETLRGLSPSKHRSGPSRRIYPCRENSTIRPVASECTRFYSTSLCYCL